jgi:hypothetical protein
MTRRSLTEKPSVPALVRAAAISALAWTPLACGDDAGGNTSDVFPTDACVHDPAAEGCEQTTGGMSMSMSGDDAFPTTPCAHDPESCESTGQSTSTTSATETDTDASSSSSGSATDTDTDTDTATDTDASSSSTSG